MSTKACKKLGSIVLLGALYCLPLDALAIVANFEPSPFDSPPSVNVEITGYALLRYTAPGRSVGMDLLKW